MPTTQPITLPWDHITSLVVALTGLVTAIAALWKIAGARAAAESAKADAAHASDKSDTNARAIDGMQAQITAVALQTPPTPVQFNVPPAEPPK